jgi:hypothetical protein
MAGDDTGRHGANHSAAGRDPALCEENPMTDRPGLELPEHIICVDCGGRCHLASYPPHEGWQPGDIVFYRCEDCRDRWDIEIPLD